MEIVAPMLADDKESIVPSTKPKITPERIVKRVATGINTKTHNMYTVEKMTLVKWGYEK